MNQITESVDVLIRYGNTITCDKRTIPMSQIPQFNSVSTRSLYSIDKENLSMVRDYFQEKNWLLLTSSTTMHTLYLCPRIEFEQRVSDHFMNNNNNNAYTLIKDCSGMTSEKNFQAFFNHILRTIDTTLTNFYRRRQIDWEQLQQLFYCEYIDNQITSMKFLMDTSTVCKLTRHFLSLLMIRKLYDFNQ